MTSRRPGESMREFWERVIPPSQSFWVTDVVRLMARMPREDGRPFLSRRTIQRHIAAGWLRAQGGSDRALRHYRVLREDLIDWLSAQDSITGIEPPDPKPLTRRQRKRERARERAAPSAKKTPPPHHPWFGEQYSLLDD